jgi:hypothetical protein
LVVAFVHYIIAFSAFSVCGMLQFFSVLTIKNFGGRWDAAIPPAPYLAAHFPASLCECTAASAVEEHINGAQI